MKTVVARLDFAGKKIPRNTIKKFDSYVMHPQYLCLTIIVVRYVSALMVTLTSSAWAEIRVTQYSSVPSCTSDRPQLVVKNSSKIQCAAACEAQSGVREYNCDETTKDCRMYKHKPLFYEAVSDCTGYKVRWLWLDCRVKVICRQYTVSQKTS